MRLVATLLLGVSFGCQSFTAAEQGATDAGVEAPPTMEAGAQPPVDAGLVVPVADADVGAGPTAVTNGLLARWAFDEGSGAIVTDTGPMTKFEGIITTGATLVPGERHGTLFLDGSSAHAEVPVVDGLELTDTFSVALWAKLDPTQNDPRFFAYGYSFDIKLNGASRPIQLTFHDGAYALSVVSWQLSAWHHLVVTFTKGNADAYVDGVKLALGLPAGGAALPQNVQAALGPITIGSFAGGDQPAKGSFDDVRLYNRVLTGPEVAILARQ